MVRTIMINQPTGKTALEQEEITSDSSGEADLHETNEPNLTFYTDSDETGTSILDDFNLSISSNISSAPVQDEQTVVPPSVTKEKESQSESDTTWQKYMAEVNLEIMRTRDFYSSVLKGGSIESVIVGGGEKDWDRLQESFSLLSEFKIEKLFHDAPSLPC